jgi:hypothetical protein
MHRLAALALVVGCSSPPTVKPLVLGEPPSFDTNVTMRPNVAFDAADTSDAELARAAIQFARSELGAEVVFDGAVVDPDLISIALRQEYNGLPVVGGHLGLVVKRGKVILAQGTLAALRDLETMPTVAMVNALSVVRDGLATPHRGDRDTGRLVVHRGRLAWEVSAWRGDAEAIVYIDAHRGDVIESYDATRYEYTGVATNNVDERTVGDSVIALPAAHLRLRTARGATTLTDDDGSFKLAGEGRLFVSANLMGRYVNVQNLQGENATFIGVLRPETKYELEWTETRSLPEERDVFRGATITNRFVSTVFKDIPWLSHSLLAKVNHARNCNAFWNGSSINFFTAGNGCNNSGRIFDVIAHEWGHGFDQNAPGGAQDGALGEFIGDLISFVQTKSPLLAPNFFTNGKPVRDLDDPRFQCFDPEVRQVHDAGQLLGALMFDVMTDLEAAGVTGEHLKRLMLRPIAIGQTRTEWYSAILAVDDDDGDLTNGTPHECLIYRQYKAHSCKGTRWIGMPDRDPPGCE